MPDDLNRCPNCGRYVCEDTGYYMKKDAGDYFVSLFCNEICAVNYLDKKG